MSNTPSLRLERSARHFLSTSFVLITSLWLASAHAGPPFLTDDPQPVDYQHNEFYVFSTLDRTADGKALQLPGFEYNRGIFPDVQFHVVVSGARLIPAAGVSEWGMGDTEIGIKYRFIQETDDHPQVGIFPMIEAPTGSAARGLGNGQAWYRLPVWIQKSSGDWTTYSGAGYTINRAPGARNYPFAGWLLQKQLNDSLTLGGEVFSQGADSDPGAGRTLVNLGGYWNFTPEFCLLFSAGHSIAGESHAIAYLGLYWTWGPEDKDGQ
ncbi:MAG: transporter [Bacillota bacterium]